MAPAIQRCTQDLSEESLNLIVWQRLLTALPVWLQSVGVIANSDTESAERFFKKLLNSIRVQVEDKREVDEQMHHFVDLMGVLENRVLNLEGEVLGIGMEEDEEEEVQEDFEEEELEEW